MTYFLKVYGSAKADISSAEFDELGNSDNSAYYLEFSKIYFGTFLPKVSIGDIFIQYAPISLKVKQAGCILGVYQCTSELKKGCIIGVGAAGNIKKFVDYIDVKNLNPTYSDKSRINNLLNKDLKEKPFNMSKEKNIIKFPSGSIVKGWAILREEDGRYLENKIKFFK